MENNNKLAKISLGINAVLLIAVIILFVKMPSSAGTADELEDSTKVTMDKTNPTTIAYFNNDSLNMYCDFVIEVQNEIQKVQQDAQGKITAKENEMRRVEKKWNDKGQLLPREMEQAQMEFAKLQEEYAMLQQQVQMEMSEQTNNYMMTMYDRVTRYATSFCKKNEIDMLMAYQLGGDLIYVGKDLDVTSQFINHCNIEYSGGMTTEESGEEDTAEGED